MSDIIASLKVNVRRYYYLQTTSNYEKSGSTYSPKRRFWLFTFEATSNEGQLSAYLWIVPVYTSLLRLESFSSKQCYIWTTPSGLQRRLNALDLICSLPIIRHQSMYKTKAMSFYYQSRNNNRSFPSIATNIEVTTTIVTAVLIWRQRCNYLHSNPRHICPIRQPLCHR